MPKQEDSKVEDLLPLPPLSFHLLLSLLEGERHGYALKREILARTHKKLNPGPSLLYGHINRLLEQGLIEESEERPDPHLDDQRRRYYRITPLGRDCTRAEALRMQELVRLAGAHVVL
ncbi:PadR family transcriptional regulator [Bryobacter aggregatus]|uniref:PadR family transcriptional regulator n=1 Tax=Bryobacter aggregatus TaxID=360054 RepID=UPI0004E273E9|nr:helix-turn-helix transcriptional regulator [Bryobacter aggregatus]